MDREEELAALKARVADLEREKVEAGDLTAAGTQRSERAAIAKADASFSRLMGAVAGGACLVAIVGFALATRGPSSAQGQSGNATTAQATASSQPARPEFPWVYSNLTDDFSGRSGELACTPSLNEVHLDWPYSDTAARLCLRKSPQYGEDAFISLDGDGQILCRSYDGCPVRVRIDDGPAQRLAGASAADGTSNIVFLRNGQRVARLLKGSKTVKVELSFYQAGQQTLEFRTNGLVWKTSG